jgi:hypothetical protein
VCAAVVPTSLEDAEIGEGTRHTVGDIVTRLSVAQEAERSLWGARRLADRTIEGIQAEARTLVGHAVAARN